jgi:ATP-dependent exoDNAse (exonuclease V) alpha subunit
MVDQGLAALAEDQSTWRRNDLIRELARAVPTSVTVPAGDLPDWLSRLADHTIDHGLVELAPTPPPGTATRADGRPVTESMLDRRFTSQSILDQEAAIEASAYRRFAIAGGPGNVDAGDLNRAQLDVGRAVAGAAQLTLVVGPAGTGKTTALRPGIAALRAQYRKVIALAPSATAAAVLKEETGVENADTVDAFLLRMRMVQPGRGGTTVIVDEASMLSTDRLAQLLAVADRHGQRLVLVGDPMQLSAVGRGGMFAHLTRALPTIELEQVHRFTNAWERQASLDLRAGRVEALDTYDDHGRIHGGHLDDLERQVVDRWLDLRQRGSVAVLAGTNETVRMQQHRLERGELAGSGWQHPNGQTLYVGDHVATRRNDRQIRTDRGEMIRNRARWTIEAIDPDGSVTVQSNDGRVVLPAAYVADHLELAYAETIHAAQGRTVDHGLVLIDGPADGAAVYVGLTRGRQTNTAYVATEPERSAVETLEDALERTWTDRPAIELQVELASLARERDRERGVGTGLGR